MDGIVVISSAVEETDRTICADHGNEHQHRHARAEAMMDRTVKELLATVVRSEGVV
jgi:hypothetical protein